MGKILYSLTAIFGFISVVLLTNFLLEVNNNSQVDLLTCQPYNVEITEITKNEALIIWETKGKCSGKVKYGEGSDNLEYIAMQEEESKGTEHSAIIQGLFPNTQYYYVILSESELYANQGQPLEFETAAL